MFLWLSETILSHIEKQHAHISIIHLTEILMSILLANTKPTWQHVFCLHAFETSGYLSISCLSPSIPRRFHLLYLFSSIEHWLGRCEMLWPFDIRLCYTHRISFHHMANEWKAFLLTFSIIQLQHFQNLFPQPSWWLKLCTLTTRQTCAYKYYGNVVTYVIHVCDQCWSPDGVSGMMMVSMNGDSWSPPTRLSDRIVRCYTETVVTPHRHAVAVWSFVYISIQQNPC